MDFNVEVKLDYDNIKVKINNLTHVSILRNEYVGYSSWIENECYNIEYVTKTNTILTEYNSIEKWKLVLNKLDEKL